MENKKEIVIFAGDYFPFPSPNGVCLKNITDVIKDEFKITIIAYNQDNGKKNRSIDGVDYIFISSPSMRLYNVCRFKKGFLYKALSAFLRLIRGLKTAFFWLRFDRKYFLKCISETKKLCKTKKIDAIVAACYPFSAIYAAYKCKKKLGIDYITYILDVYSEAKNLRKVCLFKKAYKKKDAKKEMTVFENAKMNFLSEGFLKAKAFGQIKEKGIPYQIIGFPLIGEERILAEKEKTDKEIRLFYAGTFIKGVREPNALMKVFSMSETEKLRLTICAVGDCNDELEKWAKPLHNVDFKGSVGRKEANALAEQANFLINVANLNEHQIPSKIFEYFQTGKPIINFYNEEKQNEIFGGYGAVFNIPQKQPEMYAKALVDFCGKYKDKTVPIETVKKNYRQYTIKHISDLFKKELNDCNGEKS